MQNAGERAIRVLAADDSAVMREVMRTIFDAVEGSGVEGALPRMELCGVARDGVEAVDQAVALVPDVLVLDLEMPRLDGLGVLARLRTLLPRLPVILCSTYTERGARATLDGLAHGAKDYVTKPEHQRNYGAALDSLRRQLLPKIAALAPRRPGLHPVPHPDSEGTRACAMGSSGGAEVVVIGISTGGPPALEVLLPALPRDLSVPVLIVQHMPRLFTGALAERLNRLCRVAVEEAKDGSVIGPGKIWLAPGDRHMEIVAGLRSSTAERTRVIRLRAAEPPFGAMPSVDLLFRSAAKAYGAKTLAVVMTGMGSDGLEGARAVRGAGGTVLVQDQASSTVWGMPARVAEAGLAAAALPLEALAGALLERVQAIRKAVTVRQEAVYGML